MVKVKTSIYIDKDLWERFKKYALRKGMEVSNLLENIIEEEMTEEALDKVLLELAKVEDYEIDFEPIEPKKGPVSELIRAMRNGRSSSLLRQ